MITFITVVPVNLLALCSVSDRSDVESRTVRRDVIFIRVANFDLLVLIMIEQIYDRNIVGAKFIVIELSTLIV